MSSLCLDSFGGAGWLLSYRPPRLVLPPTATQRQFALLMGASNALEAPRPGALRLLENPMSRFLSLVVTALLTFACWALVHHLFRGAGDTVRLVAEVVTVVLGFGVGVGRAFWPRP